MAKRFLILLLAFVLAATALSHTTARADDDRHQAQIDRLNALLNGLGLGSEFTQTDTAHWTDEALAHAVYRKLIWSFYYSDEDYLQALGINTYGSDRYDLAAIDRLSQDCYGRDFPRNVDVPFLQVEGDTLLIFPAYGESTKLAVQDYYVVGNRVTAVGMVAALSGLSKFEGYFKAEFEIAPESVYGFTLVSLEKLEQNQDFSRLEARASSILVESSVTHYASRLLDGDLGTAWVEGVDGVGRGEWVEISNPTGKKLQLIGVQVHGGYQLDQRRLDNNGWPTEILIECEGGFSQRAEFFNYDGVFILDEAVETSWVRFTILEAQAGEKYEDTCISEISLLGLDFSAMVPEGAGDLPVQTQPEPTKAPEMTQEQETFPDEEPQPTVKPAESSVPQLTATSAEATKPAQASKDNKAFIAGAIFAAGVAVAIVYSAILIKTVRKKKKIKQQQYNRQYSAQNYKQQNRRQ